jgi:rare lipoprotein A
MHHILQYLSVKSVIIFCLLSMNCSPSARYQKSDILKTSFSNHGEFVVIASYYGQKFHGKQTASGEIFNMYGLTAAHKTLPFGTIIEVTNKKSNKSVIVRINDRGPFVTGRELDLSFQAAKNIGLIRDGYGKVHVRVIILGND